MCTIAPRLIMSKTKFAAVAQPLMPKLGLGAPCPRACICTWPFLEQLPSASGLARQAFGGAVAKPLDLLSPITCMRFAANIVPHARSSGTLGCNSGCGHQGWVQYGHAWIPKDGRAMRCSLRLGTSHPRRRAAARAAALCACFQLVTHLSLVFCRSSTCRTSPISSEELPMAGVGGSYVLWMATACAAALVQVFNL